MTPARTAVEYTETLADLQRRYAYNIPQAALDRLKYGSATNAAIVETEDLIAFYKSEIFRINRSACRWGERGNLLMMNATVVTVREYSHELSRLRAKLTELRGTNAAVQGAGRFFEALNPKGPDDG